MQATTILGIAGVLVVLVAVVITHILNQRGGENRANQVRHELAGRMTGMEQSLSKDIESLDRRLAQRIESVDRRLDDFRRETNDRLGVLRASVSETQDDVRRSSDALKELFRAEIKAATMEIRAVIADKSCRAGHSD